MTQDEESTDSKLGSVPPINYLATDGEEEKG